MQQEEAIFIQRPKKVKPKIIVEQFEPQLESAAYTFNGNGKLIQINPTSDRAFAKTESIKDRIYYFVKLGKIGRNRGRLINPKGLGFTKGEESARIGNIPCYQWHKVKKQIFIEYINFLKTGEQKWLRSAQGLLRS